jgi:H+/Cl- antiporter ClcA
MGSNPIRSIFILVAVLLILFLAVIISLIIWTAVWKALALWKSARNDDLVWFIILSLVNTLGILEILYIYVFSKDKSQKKKKKVRR